MDQKATPTGGDRRPAPADRIYLLARIMAIILVPILLLGFASLYLRPHATDDNFAWPVGPPMTAMIMGSGYMVGAYFFARMSFGRRWHHHGIPLPAVTIFASTMAVLTIIHWDNFTHDNFVFFLWAFLYAVTPFIVIGVWLWNRTEDPGALDDGGIAVPTPIRQGLMLSGVGGVIVAIVLFFFPDLAIENWPWTLSTLTARTVAGWIALGGSAAILVGRDVRWSAWRIPFETTFLWTILLAIGVVRFSEDFDWGAFSTWAFLAIITGLAVSFGAVLLVMERRQRRTDRAAVAGSSQGL